MRKGAVLPLGRRLARVPPPAASRWRLTPAPAPPWPTPPSSSVSLLVGRSVRPNLSCSPHA
eukprot:scaffold107176_cov12-Phaeocystis_antarctica.AAC.1